MLTLPETLYWENFSDAVVKTNIFNSMKNSIIVTVAGVLIILVAAFMACYAIGRQRHKKGYRFYESTLSASMMIPALGIRTCATAILTAPDSLTQTYIDNSRNDRDNAGRFIGK